MIKFNRFLRKNKLKCIIIGGFILFSIILIYNSQNIINEDPFDYKESLIRVVPKKEKKNCNITLDNIVVDDKYPKCKAKMEWMVTGWTTDSCYSDYGVNGSLCSFYEYLSLIENHCKPLKGNISRKEVNIEERLLHESEKLFDLMADNPTNFQYIKSRIKRLFEEWKLAVKDMMMVNKELKHRKKMNIVLYLGFLSKETGLKFGEKAGYGGPLGELVQWSDLITSLYLLGHDIAIATEFTYFRDVTMKPYLSSNACPSTPGVSLDLIFTDIIGLRKIKQKIKNFYQSNKCRIRLLDSFGTHAEFNDMIYFKNHWKEFGVKRKNPWGGLGLELQQFLTMYPHTDDNTFLGFVVETFDLESDEIIRKNEALIYGKEKYMWINSSTVLNTLNQFMKIKSTVADADKEFKHYLKENNVENYGLLSGIEYQKLLRKTKVFIGLGFPLEGPAPLEAISHGAIFINHRFDPPKSRLTYKFFDDKPTLRELTSQSPYMERFVGEPYVFTIDVFNSDELEKTIKKIIDIEIKPYLPVEFSFEGMLERVDVILTKQDFCGMEQTWPPFESSRIILSEPGESCQDICQKSDFICERSFFRKINTKEMLISYADCQTDITQESVPYAPAECILQQNSLLFSCATHPRENIRRLCPCRTYKKGQIVLCDNYC